MDYLNDLNEAQRQAVMHADGPLLVLAGAGSGKTRVITRRIANLTASGVAAPWEILAITFTNKAAGELRERIASLGVGSGITACTFHSLCARLLREFAAEAGLETNFSIYDAADQSRLIKQVVKDQRLSVNLPPAAVLAAISRAKMALQGPDEIENEATVYNRALGRAYAAYQRALTKANAMDFDDLLMKMAFLLRDNLQVRERLSRRYRYVLIDEYQDTNRAQYVIAHGIALAHRNICATGDPDQCIYSWRGADINNILDFEKDYPDAVVVRLEENYRSTNPILRAASRLIACNSQRKGKDLYSSRDGGRKVTVMTAVDEHAEAAEVARRVKQLVAEGDFTYDDFAIFYRVNSVSRVMEDAFRRSFIPYRIARGVEFYNRKEIRDVLAYLKLLANPADDIACERIINVPARGIGATTLERLRQAAGEAGVNILHAGAWTTGLSDAPPGMAHTTPTPLGKAGTGRVKSFVELIGRLKQDVDGPVQRLVERVIAETGMEKALKAHGSEDGSELDNVRELVNSAADFDRDYPGSSLADYLQQTALISDIDRFEGGGGAVTLMTLHAAKGLEFPAVFIVGCEHGLLPFQRALEEGNEEEERRLCFVGMTRAMRMLTLSRAKYRGIMGARQLRIASRFLVELNGEEVEIEDLVNDGMDLPQAAGAGDPWDGPDDSAAADPFDDDGFYDPDLDSGAESGIKRGSRVRHGMFGVGRVDKVSKSGPHTRVVVDFHQVGRKTLILQYARLELLR